MITSTKTLQQILFLPSDEEEQQRSSDDMKLLRQAGWLDNLSHLHSTCAHVQQIEVNEKIFKLHPNNNAAPDLGAEVEYMPQLDLRKLHSTKSGCANMYIGHCHGRPVVRCSVTWSVGRFRLHDYLYKPTGLRLAAILKSLDLCSEVIGCREPEEGPLEMRSARWQ